MGKKALEVKNFTSDELKLLFTNDHSFQQAIRLFACYQIAIGIDPEMLLFFMEHLAGLSVIGLTG